MFETNKQLKKLRKEATPSRAFTSLLLKQLKSEMKQTHMPTGSIFARYGAVGVTSLALLLGSGTGVYAYESPDVVEGHPLYEVKNQIEGVEGRIAAWRGQDPQFHARMADRRLDETERHQGNREKVEKLLTAAAEELGITMQELQQGLRDEDTREDLMSRLTAADEEMGSLLERFVERVQEHEQEEGPRQEWLEKVGLGDEVSAFREELKNSDMTNDEKREAFREKMKELLDAQKEKIDARRDELEAQGLEDEDIREQIHEEFGPPPGGRGERDERGERGERGDEEEDGRSFEESRGRGRQEN